MTTTKTPQATYWARALLAAVLTLAGCDVLNPPDPTLALVLDGTELRQTTINDGAVQSGEYVLVDFFLTNTSDVAYLNVSAAVTTSGPVQALQAYGLVPSRTFDRIEPGQSVGVVVEFKVNVDTPAGTSIPLTLTLTDIAGVAVSFPSTLTTVPLPHTASAEDVAVTQDTDGDGRVEPGEEATVRFTPRFTGTTTATASCGEARVSSPLAQVVYLTPTSGLCSGTFRFRASSTLAPGTAVPFVITIADRLGNTWRSDVSVPLG